MQPGGRSSARANPGRDHGLGRAPWSDCVDERLHPGRPPAFGHHTTVAPASPANVERLVVEVEDDAGVGRELRRDRLPEGRAWSGSGIGCCPAAGDPGRVPVKVEDDVETRLVQRGHVVGDGRLVVGPRVQRVTPLMPSQQSSLSGTRTALIARTPSPRRHVAVGPSKIPHPLDARVLRTGAVDCRGGGRPSLRIREPVSRSPAAAGRGLMASLPQPLFAIIAIRLNARAKSEATLAMRLAFKSRGERHRYELWAVGMIERTSIRCPPEPNTATTRECSRACAVLGV